MSTTIPDKFMDLVKKPAFASLATIMPDGSPQVTPVWWDYDGQHILVNSAVGRIKDRNMRRNPHVALSIMDPANPYRYMEVQGVVVEITQMGADELIDRLAQKYMNVEKYPYRSPEEVRVTFKISPVKVSGLG